MRDDILKTIEPYFTSTQTVIELTNEIMEVIEKYEKRKDDDLK